LLRSLAPQFFSTISMVVTFGIFFLRKYSWLWLVFKEAQNAQSGGLAMPIKHLLGEHCVGEPTVEQALSSDLGEAVFVDHSIDNKAPTRLVGGRIKIADSPTLIDIFKHEIGFETAYWGTDVRWIPGFQNANVVGAGS
jgi:hypothetical protein